MKKYFWFLSFCFAWFSIQGCGQNDSAGGVSTLNLKEASTLEEIYKVAKKSNNIRSMLISHNDSIIAGEYFGIYSRDSLDHMRSVTKSVMATLIGIALDKGIIGNINEPISKYLGEAVKGKENITIWHLLTMTSGIKWNEGASGYNAWIRSGDHINYVLNKPMAHAPGKAWNYNSAGTHLLSVILTKAAGISTLEFANKYLFEPIGIKNVRWETITGYHNGGAGLELKPRDMIKFGQLYAHKGIFNGQRILSEKFIKDATSLQQPEGAAFDENEGYGYCWWVADYPDKKLFAALGYAGQLIAIAPEHNIVLAITHHWRVNEREAVEQTQFATKQLAIPALEAITKGKWNN